jgi:hypothetical protein
MIKIVKKSLCFNKFSRHTLLPPSGIGVLSDSVWEDYETNDVK